MFDSVFILPDMCLALYFYIDLCLLVYLYFDLTIMLCVCINLFRQVLSFKCVGKSNLLDAKEIKSNSVKKYMKHSSGVIKKFLELMILGL